MLRPTPSGPDDIDGDRLRRQAERWVAGLTGGEATPADRDALQAWRGLGPDHEAAFQEAVRLWRGIGPAAALLAAAPVAAGRPRTIGRRAFLGGTAIAAGVLGAAVIGPALHLWPGPRILLADHRTGIGEQREVPLPDGSRVLLDAATAIAVAFTPASRQVELLTGEAMFTVAADPARPFVVSAGSGRTKAIGTVFTVRNLEPRQRVQCLEGVVSVATDAGGEPVLLQAGHGVAYDRAGPQVPEAVDPATAAPWRNGLLTFRDEMLSEVVAALNRYRPGHVAILSDETARRRVTGVFHLDRPDEALAHLRRTLALDATELGPRYVLLH